MGECPIDPGTASFQYSSAKDFRAIRVCMRRLCFYVFYCCYCRLGGASVRGLLDVFEITTRGCTPCTLRYLQHLRDSLVPEAVTILTFPTTLNVKVAGTGQLSATCWNITTQEWIAFTEQTDCCCIGVIYLIVGCSSCKDVRTSKIQ